MTDEQLAELHCAVAAGFMGDPDAWRYWDLEYPDEGSTGPFASREEAIAHFSFHCLEGGEP